MEKERPSRHFSSALMKVLSSQFLWLITVVSHILVIWISLTGSFFPSYDVLSSIVSSFAEIIAGLYGITMASYTFFLSRIDALLASDRTLEVVVASVKLRFKRLIWVITFHVTTTLFVTMILMYMPAPEGGIRLPFYRLFCNEFILSVIFSILLILGYSILVINPHCLEKEAKKLKKKLSPRQEPAGSVLEFLSLYHQLEACCESLLPGTVLSDLQALKGRCFDNTLALLEETRPEIQPLIPTLLRVHRYHCCVLNAPTLSVSDEMCAVARWVLHQLEEIGKSK